MARRVSIAIAALTLILGWPTSVIATTIDFESLSTGEPVDTQFLASLGVEISAVNNAGGPDVAIIFDSLTPGPVDPDLQGPVWSMGNLAGGQTELGNLAIIAETLVDSEPDGFVDMPDDARGGSFFFQFQNPIHSFGFDLIDIEDPGELDGFVALFFMDDTEIGRIGFDELVDAGSPFFDASIVFGDHTANRIQPIRAADFNVSGFDRVEIHLGGSGAIDNVEFTPVPEPATLVLFGLLFAALAVRRARR